MKRYGYWSLLTMLWTGCFNLAPAAAETQEDRIILLDPTGDAPVTVTFPDPPHRLALGINYLGGQARWYCSKAWAAEGQFQTGKAASHYGDVRAQVYGLRAYRYLKPHGKLALYAGPELAYTTAKSANANYETTGFTVGAFGGFDYFLAKRLSLGIDIGPYVISLKETQTSLSQTNLDFVINTQLNWHLL